MLSINQTPVQQPTQTPTFKAGKKLSVKDMKKALEAMDDANFMANLMNAPAEQRPYMLNLRMAEKWHNMSPLEKTKLIFKGFCNECVNKLNPKNRKK